MALPLEGHRNSLANVPARIERKPAQGYQEAVIALYQQLSLADDAAKDEKFIR